MVLLVVASISAILVSILGAASAASAAAPAKGAAFTSTNTSSDGTGHCKNGNEDVNCNIYEGKQYVWLNGGPSTAYIGDGSYFFAVLSPGGQADPNDGMANNLSDDVDAYTNRTFTVSGDTASYSGTHDFANNKIRLAEYADTSNPGGVYILAICSLADAYPVTASKCKYDAFKIQEGQVEPGKPLTVSKDADGAYDYTYKWSIAKDVDKTTVKQVGGSATFNYTVTVTHDGGTISGVKVTGTITVTNPNVDGSDNTVPVSGVEVTDGLSDGTTCTVPNGANVTLTAFKTPLTYSCDLPALPSGTVNNTVTATWPEQLLDNGSLLTAYSANFTFEKIAFTENTIDECTNVTDTQVSAALGPACVGADTNPKAFKYPLTVPVPQYDCQAYDNSATFTTNDTGGTGSDGKSVRVCGPARTGALTLGFWKGPNGNGLIQNYCAPTGRPSLATYLSGLGDGGGPFSDAAGKSCKDLVTYVNAILNGASATNMNNMLKAQMLGTALDVYYSDKTLGWSPTATGKIKAPSSFFSGTSPLGSFNMDLTAICPMVDNLSTGAATCANNTPSTNGFAAGAMPWAAGSVQRILDYEATAPNPFNGSTTSSVWYGGGRAKQEIAKNVFDQINNQLAFSA